MALLEVLWQVLFLFVLVFGFGVYPYVRDEEANLVKEKVGRKARLLRPLEVLICCTQHWT